MRSLYSRSRSLARAVTILTALAACLIPAATAQAAEPFVPAQSARSFGDSTGVNVRLTWLDTAYGNYDTIKARLVELGVRNVRDGLCPSCRYQVDALKSLAAVGIRSNLGVGTLQKGPGSIAEGLARIRKELLGSVISIEAPNEPDISGVANWITGTRAFQKELFRQVNADPALAALPVLGPSLVQPASRAALGDLSGYLDRGNLHPYSGGLPPLWNLASERTLASVVSGSKPLVATEVGFHTDLALLGGHHGATEQVIATYTPRIFLEAFRGGIDRTYLFQLLDPLSAAEQVQRGWPHWENTFGLLRNNLTPKPSFYALRNLLRAVDSRSAPVAAPGGLRLALEGAGSDVRKLLLRSANGSYSLVLWRGVSIWNRDADQALTPAPDGLEVVLGDPIASASRFDPVSSAAPTGLWSAPRRIPVQLGGAPVVLRFNPAKPPGLGPGGTAGAKRAVKACPAGVLGRRHKRRPHQSAGASMRWSSPSQCAKQGPSAKQRPTAKQRKQAKHRKLAKQCKRAKRAKHRRHAKIAKYCKHAKQRKHAKAHRKDAQQQRQRRPS